MPGVVSLFLGVENNKGEDGIVVPMWLPSQAMDVFETEFQMVMNRIPLASPAL